MTEIVLHEHGDISWVSWRGGRSGFGAVHLERSGSTLCGVAVPSVGRVVRNQFSAAIEDICTNCLKAFANTNREG